MLRSVRPTSAVLEFADTKPDAKAASEKLKVDGVLEGYLFTACDSVRVTLHLTDARTGLSVWSDSVDSRRGGLLKLIDDVSARTVAGLNQRIGIQQPQLTRSTIRPSNPKVYEEYVRARSLSGSFEPARRPRPRPGKTPHFRSRRQPHPRAALRVALVHAKLGNHAEAITWLCRAADGGNHSWCALIKHPWLQPLQSDPHFRRSWGRSSRTWTTCRTMWWGCISCCESEGGYVNAGG